MQSVGQIRTQSAQPLQRETFSTGSSRIGALFGIGDRSSNGRGHQTGNQILDESPSQWRKHHIPRTEVIGQPSNGGALFSTFEFDIAKDEGRAIGNALPNAVQ